MNDRAEPPGPDRGARAREPPGIRGRPARGRRAVRPVPAQPARRLRWDARESRPVGHLSRSCGSPASIGGAIWLGEPGRLGADARLRRSVGPARRATEPWPDRVDDAARIEAGRLVRRPARRPRRRPVRRAAGDPARPLVRRRPRARPRRRPGRPARPARAGGRVPRRAAARDARTRARRADRRRRWDGRPHRPGRRRRRVVRLNPAGERLLGVAAADALGRTCDEVLGCDVAGGHGPDDCPLAEVMASGGPVTVSRDRDPRRRRRLDPRGRRLLGGRPHGSDGRTPAGGAQATAIVRDISAASRPRGAARGVRGDGQPRAAHPAVAHPRLRRDAPPPRPRPGRAARLHRADR